MSGVTVVGLTGQTGAGKSTISKVFHANGFEVINADIVARQVVEKGKPCLAEIEEIFGSEVIDSSGNLDRRKLGGIVFTDRTKLETLNTITYPYITQEILRQINAFSDSGKNFILLDAPTLFESRADDFCEIIISVLADSEIRKQRIIRRDGLTPEQAQNRINSQFNDEFFETRSDYIIHNNGSLETVSEMAQEIADKIRCCYKNK
ncbi:MAG: dephospho-CoA kinase [Ruminococcus flavefaciens]|nr:dephospho-CoA kinase [Ruminococcus flavefaciens]